MTSQHKTETEGAAEERRLWRRYRAATAAPAAPGAIDEGLIAAYLDGQLGGAEQDAVEAWLVANPDAFGVLATAAETRAAGHPGRAPARVRARARALVAGPTAFTFARNLGSDFGWILRDALARLAVPLTLRNAAEWSATAAVFAAACVIGFQFGLSSATPQIELARGEVAAFDMAAPLDGLYDPYLPDPFDQGPFLNGDMT